LKHTSMSPYAFRLIYNDVIDTLLREHTGAITKTELYDIFSLSNCQSADDLDDMLRRLCDSILTAEDAHACCSEGDEDSSMAELVHYMQDHYPDPELSISAIAEAFDMPTARLSLTFKELMRMSPLEYLTMLRVKRSKELLVSTDLSIKEIATQVGYYDASSFIRRFKQITGVTPLQYRRSKEENSHGTHAEG
ncbi:MAG: helix-turn-helix domain-containing protein, partial [Aristaeellaceae bacterium]